MPTAYIALGSNVGGRMQNLAQAIQAIAHLPETHVEDISKAYVSRAAYVEDQPYFLNAVVSVSTGLEADALLDYLLEIEDAMGRVRETPNGPRGVDLDLLLYGDEEWNSEKLVLPHPRMRERAFVVIPLLEIAPHVRMPDGSRLHRDEATIGPIIAEEGEIPDYVTEHQIPVDADDWVVVAETESPADSIIGFDAALQVKSAALDEEGIPFAYDPYEPGTELDPFGMRVIYKLMVPSEFAERARMIAEEVAAAPPDFSGLEE